MLLIIGQHGTSWYCFTIFKRAQTNPNCKASIRVLFPVSFLVLQNSLESHLKTNANFWIVIDEYVVMFLEYTYILSPKLNGIIEIFNCEWNIVVFKKTYTSTVLRLKYKYSLLIPTSSFNFWEFSSKSTQQLGNQSALFFHELSSQRIIFYHDGQENLVIKWSTYKQTDTWNIGCLLTILGNKKFSSFHHC